MKTSFYFSVFLLFSLFANVNAQVAADSSLIGYFPFEGTAKDHSSYANNGIIFGNPKSVKGVNGCALLFDGVDDYIQVAHSPSLNSIDKEVTIIGWAYPLSIFSNGFIIITTKGNVPGLSVPTPFATIYRNYNGSYLYPYLRFASAAGDAPLVELTNNPNGIILNQWNFIAWRFKSGQCDVFLNDRKFASYTYNYTQLYKNTSPIEFARDGYGDVEFFHGILDEFCIFNRALSDEEIFMTYRNGKDPQPFPVTIIDTIICPGQNYNGYNVAGTYIDTLVAQTGCDSIVKINLKLLPNISFTEDTTICEGEVYAGYNKAGVYVDTFQCSVRTINLSIKPTSSFRDSVQICEGESYLRYTKSGIYIDTLAAQNGCDSLRIINLNVISSTNFSESVTICRGEDYRGFTMSGIYSDTLSTVNGCDSVYNLNLLVKEDQVVRIDTSICKGNSIYGYSAPGTYQDSFFTKEGCDSVRVLQLSLKPTIESSITQFICEGDDFAGYGETGIYVDTFAVGLGCDSVRTLNLQVGSVFIPNVFSPNDDNTNDYFQVFSKDESIKINTYQIYDRWGSLLYQAGDFALNDASKKWWNGEYKNKKVNNGIYTYYIEILCSGKLIPYKGEITVLNK
jgi:gliding motility-associated-like protein